MDKNFKYKNTIVIGFDNVDDPKRKEITDLLSQGVSDGWCLFIANDILNDKGVKIGDWFRCVEYGKKIKIIEVGFNSKDRRPFVVCEDDDYEGELMIKYFDELLDIRRWAKMNQYKENDDG